MLRNYLTVAFRNLMRYPGYSLINIVGLSIGLASVILIGLFVQYEFSFDYWHPDKERIYRLVREVRTHDASSEWREYSGGAVAPAMTETFPEVEQAVRMYRNQVWGRVGEKMFRQVLNVVEPEFFDFFDFPMAKGQAEALFANPNTMIITQAMARKFYGREDVVGRVMEVEDAYFAGDYVICGILKDPPVTSSIPLEFLISPSSNMPWTWSAWTRDGYFPVRTFVRLAPGTSPQAVEAKLVDAMARNVDEKMAQGVIHHLQPFENKYLYSQAEYNLITTSFNAPLERYGDIRYVHTSLLVAVFVLVIACANFMNLSTARSMGRAREVGLRKVVGAYRGQLVAQFLGEAILFTFISLGLALIVAELVLPMFNNLVERPLQLNIWDQSGTLLGLLGIAVLTGVLAGSYPAVFLSSFHPATVLKGAQGSSAKGGWVRKGLVVFQFAMSIFLVVATLVVYNQLQYVQSKDLGFDREQMVILPMFWMARSDATLGRGGYELKKRYNQVKAAAMQHPNVLRVGGSRFYLQEFSAYFDFRPAEMPEPLRVRAFGIEEDFFTAYDIPFVSGRTFDRSFVEMDEYYRWNNDVEEHFIINETAARQFGWTAQEAIGQAMVWDRSPKGKVIGVVKDFHIQPLHTAMEPVVFFADFRNMKLLHVKVRGEDMQETLAFLTTVWKQFLPSRPFTYEFFDEKLDSYYKSEVKQGMVFRLFALMAIFVSCLGLFGLAAFTAEQRTKEIGIRKVLGASESRLVMMLSGEFTRLVLVANVIAWPIAYWSMSQWLDGFVYRIDLSVVPFAISGIIAFGIALGTVGYQAWKAARSNPVDALKYE